MRVKLYLGRESFPLAAPFRIAGHVFEMADVVTVRLADGRARGRGEASGVYYLGDGPDRMTARDQRHDERRASDPVPSKCESIDSQPPIGGDRF